MGTFFFQQCIMRKQKRFQFPTKKEKKGFQLKISLTLQTNIRDRAPQENASTWQFEGTSHHLSVVTYLWTNLQKNDSKDECDPDQKKYIYMNVTLVWAFHLQVQNRPSSPKSRGGEGTDSFVCFIFTPRGKVNIPMRAYFFMPGNVKIFSCTKCTHRFQSS